MKIILTEEQFKRVILKEQSVNLNIGLPLNTQSIDYYKNRNSHFKKWLDKRQYDYDSYAGIPYTYEVVATVEKDGKKYDIVRYYFYIIDNNLSYVDHMDSNDRRIGRGKLFGRKKKDLLRKLNKYGEPFKPEMMDEFKLVGMDKIPSTHTESLDMEEFIESGEYKDFEETEKEYSWTGGLNSSRMTQINMVFETTYVVPHKFHFNIGNLYN
jgi:hypothetical protein